jgi:hypothetical protein
MLKAVASIWLRIVPAIGICHRGVYGRATLFSVSTHFDYEQYRSLIVSVAQVTRRNRLDLGRAGNWSLQD